MTINTKILITVLITIIASFAIFTFVFPNRESNNYTIHLEGNSQINDSGVNIKYTDISVMSKGNLLFGVIIGAVATISLLYMWSNNKEDDIAEMKFESHGNGPRPE